MDHDAIPRSLSTVPTVVAKRGHQEIEPTGRFGYVLTVNRARFERLADPRALWNIDPAEETDAL